VGAIFSFKCSSCSRIHEGSPSFAFRGPDSYLEQPQKVREAGRLDSDYCVYEDEDGPHFFIRVCLEIPIHGVAEPFLWGVWASVSKHSFQRYTETFDTPDTSDCYFAYLCNYLPYYEKTYALKASARPREGKQRPVLALERTEHPLSVDFHEGISIERAQQIAEAAVHR
jgi:hypothetical protein